MSQIRSESAILGFHCFRGCRFVQEARVVEQFAHVDRLSIFFDAFVAVLGRTVAYTIYLCMSLIEIAFRPRQVPCGQGMLRIYGCSGTWQSAFAVPVALVGLLLVWIAFLCFCVVISHAWSATLRVVPSLGVEQATVGCPKIRTEFDDTTGPPTEFLEIGNINIEISLTHFA